MNIVISGVSRGIGKAIAIKFLKENHTVIGCGKSLEHLEELSNELKKYELNDKFFYKKCDVSNKEELQEFVDFVFQQVKKVDVLVNNAGVFLGGEMTNEADIFLETMLQTNLLSAYWLTKSILPNMLQHQSGQIFNMCSVAGTKGYPSGGSYAITKHALLGFSRSLREELKDKHIKVTAIHPGATLTDSWNGTDLPEQRFIPVDDIADLVFSISKLSKYSVVEELVIRPQLGDI